MTQEQKGAVRTREEQAEEIFACFKGVTHTDGSQFLPHMGRHDLLHALAEAEARGAEEARRVDGEGQGPVGYRHVLSNETDPGESVVLSETQDSPWGTLGKWDSAKHTLSPLYTRPAKVAALEARVKELEAARERLKRLVLDVLQVCHRSKMSPEDIGYTERMIRAALTREGGQP